VGSAPPPGRAFIAIGIAQVGGLIAFSTVALRFGGVADVTALIFTMPLFTAIFARSLLGEQLSRPRLGGCWSPRRNRRRRFGHSHAR